MTTEEQIYKTYEATADARCADAEFYIAMLANVDGTVTLPADYVLELTKNSIRWEEAKAASWKCEKWSRDDLMTDIFGIKDHEKVVEDDN